jgi:hypothetical protein
LPKKAEELTTREVAEIAVEVRRRLGERFPHKRIATWATSDQEVVERFIQLTWIVMREKIDGET